MPTTLFRKRIRSISNNFGWLRDLPDHRDHRFAASPRILAKLPSSVDLRAGLPAPYDQGQLGSCTANALAGAFQYLLKSEKKRSFTPSRLFIYYNERVIEHHAEQDSGAMLRDGIKALNQWGACPETAWPYDPSQFATKPSAACYAGALKHQLLKYERMDQDLNQLRGCLAQGLPFVFGFTVYSAFMSPATARTGVGNLPGPGETPQGGHAVLAVGYDDVSQRFLMRNSWGSGWGQKGYFTLPYAYLLQTELCSDFWALQILE
jgi:C1A family cysteine protease